jgi:GntR family transcriptional regulator
MSAIDEPPSAQRLNRDSPAPLYRQLKWLIRHGIDGGRYQVGQRLPSENNLARSYGVSRHLVRQALSSLVTEGQVVARQGYGYYVNARRIRRELPVLTGYTAPMKDADPSSRVRVLHQQLTSEPKEIVASLTGRRDSRVFQIERLALLADEPVALLVDYFHPRFAEVLAAASLDDQPLYAFLERTSGIRPTRAPTVLRVEFASQRESSLLTIPEGSPLIRLDISTFAEDGFMFSRSSGRFRSDRFEFTLEKTAL